MTDEQALLAAVLYNPDDDTPRLVFADWLDEHAADQECPRCEGRKYLGAPAPGQHGYIGTPECPACRGTGRVANGYADRAEFIRVQCELARDDGRCSRPNECCQLGHGPCLACRDRERLRVRERELEPLREQWVRDAMGDQYRPFLHGGGRVEFSRGFIAKLTLPAAAFTETLAKAVFGVQPVTAVVLNDREPVHDMSSLEIHAAARVGSWDWYEPPHGDPDFPESVPSPVFAVMWDDYPEYQAHTGDGEQRWLEFPARDAALAALSAAATNYGRGLVSLPPLPRPGRG